MANSGGAFLNISSMTELEYIPNLLATTDVYHYYLQRECGDEEPITDGDDFYLGVAAVAEHRPKHYRSKRKLHALFFTAGYKMKDVHHRADYAFKRDCREKTDGADIPLISFVDNLFAII